MDIKTMVAMTIADVDIFLLQNKEQTGDNDKECFSREEIRNQLKASCSKILNVLKDLGVDIDAPIKNKANLN